MRYYQLAVLISAAAFVSATLVATALVAGLWPVLRSRLNCGCPAERARRLASLRFAPLLLGMLGGAVAAAIFLRFEPRDTAEPISILFFCTAMVLPLMAALTFTRLMSVLRASRGCARLLSSCGRVVDHPQGTRLWLVETPYPVAAVLGVFRPRLLLAARILDECSAEEVRSVIDHELAHLRRRDNLLRGALRCLPDPLGFLPAGRAIEAAWNAACEEAADDAAAVNGLEARLQLAGALIRVAGMVQSPPPPWMPTLAFFEGSNLDQRVRRLLETAPRPRRNTTALLAASLVILTTVIACTDVVAPRLHAVMESAVQAFP